MSSKKPVEKKPADKKEKQAAPVSEKPTKEKQKPYVGTPEQEVEKNKDGNKVPETLVEKKKKPEKKEERHHHFIDRIEYAATLTLMQKYDDETIKKMVDEKFPGYAVIFNQKELGRTRWMIKHDMLPNVHANGKPFDRCFLIEGKIVPRSEKPKAKYSRKPKYTPENDPLAKFAGVNVHDKKPMDKKPVDKKPVKKAEQATAEKAKKEA